MRRVAESRVFAPEVLEKWVGEARSVHEGAVSRRLRGLRPDYGLGAGAGAAAGGGGSGRLAWSTTYIHFPFLRAATDEYRPSIVCAAPPVLGSTVIEKVPEDTARLPEVVVKSGVNVISRTVFAPRNFRKLSRICAVPFAFISSGM